MNTKHLVLSAFIAAVLFICPRMSSAQFENGKVYLGPHIGLSAIGSSPTFGANFEVPVTQPGKAGPGIIGVSGRLDYWSWSYSSFDKFTWITIAVYGNYHFALDDKTWDPFVGLGLGYENVSWSYSGIGGGTNLYPSSIFFSMEAGARYFFSPNFALRALLGFGITYIVVGVDFAL